MARKNKRETTLSLTELKTVNIINRESHLSAAAIKVVSNGTGNKCRNFVKRDKEHGILIVETIDGLKTGVKRADLLKQYNRQEFHLPERILARVINNG